MLKEEFLSQEEIDALLKGVTNEVDEEPAEAEAASVRTYNLGSQERIVRGRMPTLEIINERFARNWRMGLFNFLRRNAEISVGPVKVQKYSEFIRNLVVPAAINLVHVKPLRGTALFVFDPNLIFIVVDHLFGGDGRFHMRVEGRDFTQVEQRIIQRMLQLMFEHYGKAWQPIYPIEFEPLRMEMHTEFANVHHPQRGGGLDALQHGARQQRRRRACLHAVHHDRADPRSAHQRHPGRSAGSGQALGAAAVAAGADRRGGGGGASTNANVHVSDILNMKVGDVVPIELDDSVTARVDGVPVMECAYGTFNGQYALRVNRMLNMNGSEPAPEPENDK